MRSVVKLYLLLHLLLYLLLHRGHRGLVDKSVALLYTADHGFESWFSRLDLGLITPGRFGNRL